MADTKTPQTKAPAKAARKTKAAEVSEGNRPDARGIVPLKPGDVRLMDQMHQTHAAYVDPAYDLEDLENPRLYSFMAAKFQDLDRIELTAEDGSFIARGVVRRSLTRDVRVQIYEITKLQAAMAVKELELYGYLIRHGGQVKKFYITNKETGVVLKEGLNSQPEAIQYLTDYINAAA